MSKDEKNDLKQFKPCLDTLLWLWGGNYDSWIAEVIEMHFSDDLELCPVCKSEWVYEGQWNWYVKDEEIHKVYQNLANGSKEKYATDGLTDKCCSQCYEDGLGDNMNDQYIRHLYWKYQTYNAVGCEGDPSKCDYCFEASE